MSLTAPVVVVGTWVGVCQFTDQAAQHVILAHKGQPQVLMELFQAALLTLRELPRTGYLRQVLPANQTCRNPKSGEHIVSLHSALP